IIQSSLLLCLACPTFAGDAPPLLLQHPSLSAAEIAFDYAGEIWTVPPQGGKARRLASGQGQLASPTYSPDGALLAFTGL
ncbi:MAG TPA: hypothetical protein VKA01_08370, partial [Vicinamibacteria bacterium]|nr:hypothetical protein [Vicinamibacteria bacterium]